MAPKLLVETAIRRGERLLKTLDQRGVKVDAALWAYNTESEQYQLVIASFDVDALGARPLYAQIQDALESLPADQRVPFRDITATSPRRGVVATLAKAIRTPADAIDSIRITGNVINQELIEDAYIYRLCLPSAQADPSVV